MIELLLLVLEGAGYVALVGGFVWWVALRSAGR